MDKPGADVAAHLARCEACRTEARRLGAAWALLKVVEPRQTSDGFASDVWVKIEAERAPGVARPTSGGPLPWSLQWAAAGLALVLAAVVPVLVWHQDRPDRPDLVAQADVVESQDLLSNFDVVADLDVLLVVDDP